jgi:hypothetical protein
MNPTELNNPAATEYPSRCPICGRGGEPPVPLSVAAEQLQQPIWKLRRAARAKIFPTYTLHDSKALCFVSDILAAIMRSNQEGAK